ATRGVYQTSVTGAGRLAWSDGTRPPEINHVHHAEELLAETHLADSRPTANNPADDHTPGPAENYPTDTDDP
ncbi:MAG: hypothetical protein ABWY45_13875, partial [Mycobacterium sp.]